ncbi:MAG: secondary thiamine-phosphate synthase enzyme YjbQ [Haloarculaceae archaeon]
MAEFTVSTDDRLSVLNITDRVDEELSADASGTATVFVDHTTAAIVINEAEQRLLSDFEDALAELVPDEGWAHDEIDDNADSHIRSLLLGPGETVPVENGQVALGTWQSVLLVECDGPRKRTVKVIS